MVSVFVECGAAYAFVVVGGVGEDGESEFSLYK